MNVQGFRWCRLSTRLAIYARDGWQCLACGRRLRWKKGRGTWVDKRARAASLDHVVPVVRGGTNDPTNLVTVCVGCNSERCDRPVEEWRPELVDVFALAVTSPLDRVLGRALAAELDPKWTARVGMRPRTQPARVSP